MAKEVAKITKMYESYKTDLEKEIASIKVVKITEKQDNTLVTIIVTDYAHGKEIAKNIYSLSLEKIRKRWKIAKLNSIELN